MKSPASLFLACLLAAVLGAMASTVHAQGVRISEFMASNSNFQKAAGQPMVDEDKSYEDWIEIHNGSAVAVDLYGWSLTDNPGNLRKWTFPRLSIAAGARLVVWASNKNRSDPALPLHTNFKIGSTGGYLALVMRDGQTIAHHWSPSYPPQAQNVSYGYRSDGNVPVYFTAASRPTPGTANLQGSTTIPPLVLDVPENLPAPEPGPVNLSITARIIQSQAAVNTVTLSWRKMFLPVVNVPMNDGGTGGDIIAGDGVWTGTVTGVSLAAGEMLRWKVAAADVDGRVGKAPAYNVPAIPTEANASSEYYGTVARDPSLASSRIPVVHWFAAAGNAGDTSTIDRVCISYAGEFYDNVGVNLHGQSTAGFPKKSYNLNFPGDRNLLLEPEGKRVKDLKLLSNYADKTKSRNTLGYEIYREAGVAAHFAFPVRVQRNGVFYALADAVEDADESYLERAGLNPEGALYKLYATLAPGLAAGESGYEKKTRETEAATDLNNLASGLALSGTERLVFGYDNIDLPATVNSLAALNMTANRDTGHKNYYLFRDTGRTDEWRLLPWDADLCLGHNWTGTYNYFDDDLKFNNDASPSGAPGSGNSFFRFGYSGSGYPSAISDMYLRRLRTLRDRFYASSGNTDWVNRRFNEMLALLDPPEAAASDADLDFTKWAAPAWKLATGPGGESPFRQNTMAMEVPRVLDEFMTVRRAYLYTGMNSLLPAAQPAAPALTIGVVDYNPGNPSSQHQEYFTVVNPLAMAIDISGWKITGAVDFVFPSGTVIPGTNRVTGDPDRNKLYVARDARGFRGRIIPPRRAERRFVVSGYSGQLSARGETLELRTAEDVLIHSKSWPAAATPGQTSLRISEVHYAPLSPTLDELALMPLLVTSDFEFIELVNTGAASLNLSGVKLARGVDYTIPSGTTLQAGAQLIIAADPVAFNLRYPGVYALGPWDGRLNNSGEEIQLLDATGESILDFDYSPVWFPDITDNGRSLVLTDPVATPWSEWDVGARWTASSISGGNPNAPSSAQAVTYESWKATHSAPHQAALEDPALDADGDGLANLMEFALGLPALTPDFETRPELVFVRVAGVDYAAFRFERTKTRVGLAWTIQSYGGTGPWVQEPAVVALPPESGSSPDREVVTLRLTRPVIAKQLLRLRVVRIPPPG